MDQFGRLHCPDFKSPSQTLTFLQAYVQFSGFYMAESSKISELHTTTCLRFVSTTMLALNPKLLQRATSESVVVGPGNVTPLTLGFTKLTILEEWSADYQLVQSRISPTTAQQLTIDQNDSGNKVLRIGRSQSVRIQDLERQLSSLSTSTSDSYPRRSTSTSSSIQTTPSRTPVYKPISNRSKLDNHLLYHQKGSKNCYFCQRVIPSQEESTSGQPPVKHIPSAPKNFRTFQSKIEHIDNILTVPNVKK